MSAKTRKGFVFHFSNLDNLKLMKESGPEECSSAVDAIIKAIEFDQKGYTYERDEFESQSGVMLYNSIKSQIEHDKPDYMNQVKQRQENGRKGGKPKEFLAKDVKALIQELGPKCGLANVHFKEVRKLDNDIGIYSFVDKKTEKMMLEHSQLFNINGSRKKNV